MIFLLDIDGVMVPAKSWKSPDFLGDGFPAFSSKATLALQSIISDDITIMLTTSHKAKYSIAQWKSIFKNRGLEINKIESLPENINNLNRKDEIISWFNFNNINEDFIIIDDDKSLNELPSFLKDHLIQTVSHIGLTQEHSEAIKTILNNGLHSAK